MNQNYQLEAHENLQGIGDWLAISILSILVLYVITRLLFPIYWKRYHQAMIFPVEANKLLEEKNTNLFQASLILNFLAIVSICIFIYLALEYNSGTNPADYKPASLLITIALGFALTLLKYYVTLLLGSLFKNEETCIRFNHAWLINLKYFGFIVLLWTIMLCYLPQSLIFVALWGAWASILIMLIINNIRGMLILRHAKISLLYGILYLCTLEILPILMILRLMSV